jgi:hypothetical protein
MLVVLLLLPLSLAVDNSEFNNGGGGGRGGGPLAAAAAAGVGRQWTMIGSKSDRQREH